MSAISLTRSITASAVLVAAAAIVAVAGFIPASASYTTIRPHPLATLLVAGDATAIFAAVNTNGSGSGIIGQSGPSFFGPAAGAGVFGIFNQSSGVGEGLLGFSQNGAGVVAENFGGSQAALYAQNFSAFAGPAIQGLSNGNAVVGTSNNTNAVVGITNAPGAGINSAVLGEDMANNGGFNNGVFGTTTSDGWGVEGTSTNGALGGVGGFATNGDGGFFQSQAIGAEGLDNNGTLGAGINTNVGLEGASTNTNGVYAVSTNRNAGAFENNTNGFFTLYLQADHTGGSPLEAVNTADGGSLTLDSLGNLTISGLIHTSGSCSSGCAAGRRVLSYAPSESQPTMEDVGEAQLVNGSARVNLDGAFANVIDTRTTYLVFITPEGDSNGVFVSQKTPTGFTVRENRGGHSTMAFSYRIVAKPIGISAPRLPMIDEGARMAAARVGASDPRVLATLRQSRALTTTRHWSAFKQYVHDHGIVLHPAKLNIPGPPPSVIRASNQMRLHPH